MLVIVGQLCGIGAGIVVSVIAGLIAELVMHGRCDRF